MEQFNLEKWLQNKNRKIVTGEGIPVRIICTDRKTKSGSIVGLVGKDESLIYVWNNDGKHIVSGIPDIDLFFADDDALTEFENKLFSVISEVWQNYLFGRKIDFAETVKEYSSELLDLARKEICLTCKEYSRGYKEGLKLGREDILKDLPKWRKANVFVSNEFGLAIRNGDLIITHNGYQIKLSDLETLPTEE